MAIKINDVALSKNIVIPGELITISVTVEDVCWETIKNDFSNWNEIRTDLNTWNNVLNYH